ncbi:MAG: cytochrome c3 family protein [Anaerolineae bacterium]|nr:cytochrome c3 family protein [Anaerolineae bacterium]
MENNNVPAEETNTGDAPVTKPKKNWIKISIAANIVLLAGIVFALAGMQILHQSDTNPEFCRTCHVMDRYVENYLTGNTLANAHAQAGVQCKECHSEYDIPAEVSSGINFVTGNYDKDFPRRKYDDTVCTQCHISMEHVAQQTDYLVKNPHLSHNSDLKCRNCHISHGEQIDFCGSCHDDTGQRMIGAEITPRAPNPFDDYPDGENTRTH